jgi:tetratricopeptide (TPR) repeat protein
VQANSKTAEALAAFRRGDLGRARVLATAQLDDEQGPPDVRHLLGLIECREGRMESGVKHLREALEAEPGNAAFRVMLARALADSGRAQDALDVAAPPAGTSPAEIAIWHARAEAAQALGRHEAAAEAWKVLCAARPEDWRVWANYGDALAGLERWEDAANALRRAWALNPNELPIQRNLAGALTQAGFYAEAADQLRKMLDSGPDDSGIRLMLSRLFADLGRHEESMTELDKAARLAVGEGISSIANVSLIRVALPDRTDPSQPISAAELKSLRELALLLERTNWLDALRTLLADAENLGVHRERLGYPAAAIALRDGDGAEAKRLLELESREVDPVRWNRLMAKILDSLGENRDAFAAAVAMNRSFRDFDSWVRKGSQHRRRIRALAEAVTPKWASRLRPLGPGPRRSPAFLVGFPRSGTTLLDTFLMGHPDTEVLEEFAMLGAAEAVLANHALLPDRSPDQLERARRAYYDELDRHVDRTFTGLVIDKMPLNMLGLPVIHTLFPDARIIFAQRHPCDAVLSAFMQSFALNDAMASFLTIEGSADLYDAAMNLFSASRDALDAAVYTLVYEELVTDPEAALQPLIRFLNLEWRPELLDHRSTAKARGAIITPSYDQVVQPLSKSRSGHWRRYEKELEPVLPVLLPWAKRLGYAD